MMEDLQEMIRREIDAVMNQREEILRAFIAKYSCQPDEIEQVEVRTETGWRWYAQRKNPVQGVHVYACACDVPATHAEPGESGAGEG